MYTQRRFGGKPLLHRKRLGPFRAAAYYFMRMLPFVQVRQLIAGIAARYVRLLAGQPAKAALPLEERQCVEAIQREGWVSLPPILTATQIDEIAAYLHTKDLIASDGRLFRLASPPQGIAGAAYGFADTLECPHVLEAMNRPDILRVAETYLGCPPTISGLRIDWFGPQHDGTADVQHYHRDYDDWRFVKLFVYLSDIDEASGPHEFVARSHLASGRLRATPYTYAELAHDYGASSFVRVCGAAGTSFMVDTWGVHKGNIPNKGYRLLLQVQYSILPVLAFQYEPVGLTLPKRFGRYANRLLVR